LYFYLQTADPKRPSDTLEDKMMTTTFFIRFRHASSAQHLLDTVLPALPQSGDWVHLAGQGYAVTRREWLLPLAQNQPIEVVLQPLPDGISQRHFRYVQTAEQLLVEPPVSEPPVYQTDPPPKPP
jgi:hypothetical protein